MASTYSTSLRVNFQGTGDNIGLWGAILNAQVFALLDTAIAGETTVAISGDTVLSSLNGQADQARAAQIALTGSPSANFTVTIPSVPKLYRVRNSAGKVATFTTGGGTTVSIDSGDIIDIQCDGTNVRTPGVGGIGWKAYISSVAAGGAGGNVPSPIGFDNQWLTNNGTIPFWSTPLVSDIGDYDGETRRRALIYALIF